MAKGVPEDVLNVLPGVVLFQIPSGGSGSSNPTRNCNFNRQRVLERVEAIRSGLLDAGFLNFMPKADAELDQLLVATQHFELAVPKRHPLTKLKKFRLRDLTDVLISGSQGAETRCSTTA